MKSYMQVKLTDTCQVDPDVILGYRYPNAKKPTIIGEYACIRAKSIVYADVVIGDYLNTGHSVLIRENCSLGDHVLIGTNTVLDNAVEVGNLVKIETNCYIPAQTKIGNRVFFGPGVIITNDRYPLRQRDKYKPEGPVIEDNVTLGGNVTICPGVTIGEGSFVGAGTVVVSDVPRGSLVIGNPGRISRLPGKLNEPNLALGWRKYLDSE